MRPPPRRDQQPDLTALVNPTGKVTSPVRPRHEHPESRMLLDRPHRRQMREAQLRRSIRTHLQRPPSLVAPRIPDEYRDHEKHRDDPKRESPIRPRARREQADHESHTPGQHRPVAKRKPEATHQAILPCMRPHRSTTPLMSRAVVAAAWRPRFIKLAAPSRLPFGNSSIAARFQSWIPFVTPAPGFTLFRTKPSQADGGRVRRRPWRRSRCGNRPRRNRIRSRRARRCVFLHRAVLR